jgi:hypothetical protein
MEVRVVWVTTDDGYTDEDCWREINRDYPDEPTYQGTSGTIEERDRQKKRLRGL